MPVSDEVEEDWDDLAVPPTERPSAEPDEPLIFQDPPSEPDLRDEPDPTPQVKIEEPLPTFDERFRQDFEGLLFLGRLEHTFMWGGHAFRLKTIDGDSLLEVGLLHKPYVGTLADIKAYQMLMVAACLVSVDGKPMAKPDILEVGDSALSVRFEQVRRWFAPTIDMVYEEYLQLEIRVQEVLAAMGEASG